MRALVVLLWVRLAMAAAATAPPVILISIDTLRADHLGAYGYRKIQTPGIDSYAQGGTIYTDVASQIPLTLPSHFSLFTSTYPFANGVEENGERVRPGLTTLAGVLRANGYQTAAFVGSALLDGRLGIGQGFDFYDSPFNLQLGSAENPYAVRVRRDASLVVRAARQWLGEHHGQPVFVFVHLFDLHAPYGHSSATGVAGYDAEIAYVDQVLARFRQALVEGGWWDRSLVVVLSDHGESLGEHGEQSHGYFVYQSTLWVPLIVHWPEGKMLGPARSAQRAGLIDVAPTVLDALGIGAPAAFQGRSLLPGADHEVASESAYTRDAFHWAALRCLRVGDSKYIEAPRAELYDLAADPHEASNRLRVKPAEAAKLRGELAALMGRAAPNPVPAAAASGQTALLGSLGYLGKGSARGGENGADPKDRLAEYNAYEKALTALYTGQPAEAATQFRQLVARDPANTLARYYWGEAYLRAQDLDGAARAWAGALAHDPEYVPAAESLGALWRERGDYAKARTYLEQALALAPDDVAVLRELALVDAKQGRLADARQHMEAACKLALDPAPCQKELQRLDEGR